MLGGLRVRSGDRTITRFRTQKTGALLAYLAYYLSRAHSREVLVELLWPWSAPAAGRKSLTVSLSSLRHQLEPPGAPEGAVIRAERFTVQLNPAAVSTDVAEFEAALLSAERASTEAERSQLLAEAVGLYGGPLLPGYYQDWILPEAERLANVYLEAVQALTGYLQGQGDVSRALDYAHRAVTVDPLREDAHRLVMRSLAAAGQPDGVLRQYRELEKLLRDQLGEPPSPATRELAERLAAGSDARPRPKPVRAWRAPSTPDVVSEGPPMGTVTFLLADIEGSRRLPREARRGSGRARQACRALLTDTAARNGGHVVQQGAEPLTFAFARPSDALTCAIACQPGSTGPAGPGGAASAPVRMALDTGEAELRDGRYHGRVLDRAMGLLVAAHGGQILCSEATAGLLRGELGPGVRLTDLGYYRLRGVELPQQLFSVQWPAMAPGPSPPPNAALAYRSNLPAQLTRFFGREEELARLEEALTRRDVRVVALTGPAGSGKTRLAIEAARRVLEPFRAAVWYVPLQDLRDAQLIGDSVSEAMALPRLPHLAPLDQVIEALSRQRSLLLLDNFEHLLTDGVMVLRTLLDRTPALTCLVTSRQILGVQGEAEFVVGGLPTPRGGAAPEELLRFPSVQLFVDRAQMAQPDFQITGRNAADVAQVCDRLEGIPLALELAAARAQVLTPARMLAQLEDRFSFLVSRKRDAIGRHRTLRAAVDWSYQLLPDELRRFFPRLSVFRGGWTVEAAQSVCEEPEALERLEQLRECSLVLADAGDDEAEGLRFRLLETLREFAWGELTSGEQAALHQAHAAYYLTLAEQAEPNVRGPDQGRWLGRLEDEHDNLRAALAWLGSADDSAEAGLRLAAALSRFWAVRGYFAEGRARLAEAIGRDEAAGRTLARARALAGAGQLAVAQGDVAAATAALEASLAIAREVGYLPGVVEALSSLGMAATWGSGDLSGAAKLLEAGVSVAREAGLKSAVAFSLGGLSRLASLRGEGGRARTHAEERLAIERELGDEAQTAEALHDVGTAALIQTDYPAARAALEEGLTIRRQLGDRLGMSQALRDLGGTLLESGDVTVARLCFEEFWTACQEMGFPQASVLCLADLARTAYYEGDHARGRSLAEEALRIARQAGWAHGIAGASLWLGRLSLAEGDLPGAQGLLAEGLKGLQAFGDKRHGAACVEALAELSVLQRQPERGVRLLAATSALREALDAPVPHIDRPNHEAMMSAARDALGERAFAEAWGEGRAMTWEEAVPYALEQPKTEQEPPTAPERRPRGGRKAPK